MAKDEKISLEKQFEEMEKNGDVTSLEEKRIVWEKEGQRLVGVLQNVIPRVSKDSDGAYNEYIFATPDGIVSSVCGVSVDKVLSLELHQHHLVSITYLGKKSIGGGRQVNQFAVKVSTSEYQV